MCVQQKVLAVLVVFLCLSKSSWCRHVKRGTDRITGGKAVSSSNTSSSSSSSSSSNSTGVLFGGTAQGTFYGGPDASGTWGGACGYGNLVDSGYGLLVAAGSAPLFQNGKGCGSCYRVVCTGSRYCTGRSLVVPITDLCPGGAVGPCCATCLHFDLSEPAFIQLANRAAGIINLSYTRVDCVYSGSIRIIATGSPYWLNLLLENVGGSGDLALIEVLDSSANSRWKPMNHSWGANWMYNGFLQAPLKFRLTSLTNSLSVVSKDACLPALWAPGQTYICGMQFPSTGLPLKSTTSQNGNATTSPLPLKQIKPTPPSKIRK